MVEPTPLDRFAAEPWEGVRWLAVRGGEGRAGLPPSLAPTDPVVVAIGPEGGFTDEEVALLTGAGFQQVTFGSNTLRFETAGLAAAATVAVLRSPPER